MYKILKKEAEEDGIIFEDFKDAPRSIKASLEKRPAFLGAIAFEEDGDIVVLLSNKLTETQKVHITAYLIAQDQINRGKSLIIKANERGALSFYGEISDIDYFYTFAAFVVNSTRAKAEKRIAKKRGRLYLVK